MMNTVRERPNLFYLNDSSKFQPTRIDYSYQYYNIYIKRLEQMHHVLSTKMLLKWNAMYPLVKLRDLTECDYDSCVVIGTIFKDQKLKPSVLKQFAEAEQLVPQPVFTGKFLTDESDRLFLEDEGQRFLLEGRIDANKLVTGVTVAVMGTEAGFGKFKVEELCFASLDNYIERPIFKDDIYIIFISGLDIAHSPNSLLPIKILIQWLAGHLGELNGVDASKINRIVIAGNSLSSKTDLEVKKSLQSGQNINEQLEHVKTLDRLLLDLVQVIDVDLMPGQNDPTSYVLPQWPLHHCIFPLSSPYRSMNRVSNPYAFTVAPNEEDAERQGEMELRLLGTSGSSVKDVMQYSGGLETGLDAMEACLRWGHIAPTAPDTLGCYPFPDTDPFIIEKAPHVFFAGNQAEFQTKLCDIDNNEIRLIGIPEFSKTKEVCVLNLKNLECFTISFDVV